MHFCWIVAFLEESYADFPSLRRYPTYWPNGRKTACKSFSECQAVNHLRCSKIHSVPFSFYALKSRREQRSTEASSALQADHARKGTPTEVHCREAQRSKVYIYGWCCLKAFCVGVQKPRELWQQLALHTLLHPAALLHKKLPLVSFLALGPPLKNTLIREASIEARSCTVHADSGFQSVLCEESRFADLIILERQVPATIHFCLYPLPRGQNLPNQHD